MLIRGGTSKGLFVENCELPSESRDRDDLILDIFGSPDEAQIDGIGGSHVHSSKIIILESSDADGIEVEYTFGQVGINRPIVDYTGNCGNLTSAVGVAAMYLDMVCQHTSPAEITLLNRNTETRIIQTIPLQNGEPGIYGNYSIDGVPGTGARINSTFIDPAGGVTGSLFPTGSAREIIDIGESTYEVSIVDAANPNVFIRASDFDIVGTELPDAFSERNKLLETLERIRGIACERIGLVDKAKEASKIRPLIPQLALVSEPQSYVGSNGNTVAAKDIDVTARMFNNGKPHHSYAVTAAMCLAAATQVEGTIPFRLSNDLSSNVSVAIGHPKGRIDIQTVVEQNAGGSEVKELSVDRTARPLHQGQFFRKKLKDI